MPLFAVLVSLMSTLLGAADDPECYALGGLDVARAEALAGVNMSDLRQAYADRRASAPDRRLLQRYAARGFRIVGAGMVRDECRAVARAEARVELEVVERLAPAWAVDEMGTARRLPRGELSRHRVVLTRDAGHWRIASVS